MRVLALCVDLMDRSKITASHPDAVLVRTAAALADRLAGGAEAAGLGEAAKLADAEQSTLMQMVARPVERGMTVRLSVDAGMIRVVNSRVRTQPGAVVPGGPPRGAANPGPFVPGLAP